jgi:hypothetical protein
VAFLLADQHLDLKKIQNALMKTVVRLKIGISDEFASCRQLSLCFISSNFY